MVALVEVRPSGVQEEIAKEYPAHSVVGDWRPRTLASISSLHMELQKLAWNGRLSSQERLNLKTRKTLRH